MGQPSVDADKVARLELADGRVVRFVACGGSMKPLVFHGWRLDVVPLAGTDVRPGDMVLADLDSRLVAHWVRAVRPDPSAEPQVVLQGENNPFTEGPLPVRQVVGRVERIQYRWFRFAPRGRWTRWGYPLVRLLYRTGRACRAGLRSVTFIRRAA